MKRGHFTSAIVSTLAGSALALGIAAGAATAGTSHAAARAGTATASRTVVFDCLNHAQVRPKDYVLTCADANSVLTGLSYSSWTPAYAAASGTQMVNDCIPNCAEGKFHSYPALVVFWRSEPVAHHPGEKYFSRVTVLYPGARPPVYKNGKLVPGPETWTGGLLG
jgi:hypothetical protein